MSASNFEMWRGSIVSAPACLPVRISVGNPESIVIKQFHPKEGAEKVLSSCSINMLHLP
jgi:hypothetical protein